MTKGMWNYGPKGRGILVIFLILSLSTKALAAGEAITVKRTMPDEVYLGSNLVVTIEITNNGTVVRSLNVKEPVSLPTEYVDPPEPKIEHWEGLEAKFLEWNLTVQPHSKGSITYILKPTAAGRYSFGPTKAATIGGVYFGEGCAITVRCDANEACDTAKGESFESCPEDCTTGIEDGSCDFEQDGRCDPDCEAGYDPDCAGPAPLTNGTVAGHGLQTSDVGTLAAVILVIVFGVVIVLIIVLELIMREKRKPK